jgi:hypothetical protein
MGPMANRSRPGPVSAGLGGRLKVDGSTCPRKELAMLRKALLMVAIGSVLALGVAPPAGADLSARARAVTRPGPRESAHG